jgi:hypothetical protein
MSIPPCPYCDTSNVEWLEQMSKDGWVDYFECQDCGHIWPIAKDDFGAEITGADLPPLTENQK